MKKTTIVFILLFIPMFFGLLVGPRAPDSLQIQRCYTNINLIKPFGVSLNCDSSDFLNFAHDPSKLLEAGNVRQSRPGYIILGYLVSYVFKPIQNIIIYLKPAAPKTEIHQGNGQQLQYRLENWSAAYLAYMLIHFVTLLGATILIIKTTGTTSPSMPVIFIALFPLLNLLTKSCFFSPHTQMLNIFAPILCCWAALRSWQGRLFANKLSYSTIFLAGIGITGYATFFLVLPAILVPSFILAIKEKRISSFILHGVLKTALILIPSMAWIAFVLYKTGSYYHHEYQLGQVSWFLQEFDNNGVFAVIVKLAHLIKEIILSAINQFLPYAIIFIAVIGLAIKQKSLMPELLTRIVLAIFVSLLFAGLLSVMAYYPERLTFTLIPAWWCVAAYVVTTLNGNRDHIAIPLIMILWACVILWLDGPSTCY